MNVIRSASLSDIGSGVIARRTPIAGAGLRNR
jgi:hypothetical protein